MKFMIEPNPADYRQFLMHFDVPVEGLIPRLCDFHDREDVHDRNPSLMVRYRIGIPKKTLVGVEVIKPVSRYTMAITVGRAFLVQDAIAKIIDHLEIIIDEEEWLKWIMTMEIERQAVSASMQITNSPKSDKKNSRYNLKDKKTGKFIKYQKGQSNGKQDSNPGQ